MGTYSQPALSNHGGLLHFYAMDTIEFGSVCSGIEAASVAWHPLGWRAAWLAEIEPFPAAVLAHHYPTVPNLGDMTAIARRVLTGEVTAPDVLTGGTPCQAFSVAGLRQSLDDARGNLTLKFVELANAIDLVRSRAGKPACIVMWENVPGVLNTKDNAFGCFLAGLAGEDVPLVPPGPVPKPGESYKWPNAGCVYGPTRSVAWRTLDAQYFGVAQRRRRVFVVASARPGFDPAQVLFEWDGMRRDSAPSRETGEEAAGTLASRTGAGGFPGTDEACSGYLQPVECFGGNRTSGPLDVSTALNASGTASGRQDFESETFVVHEVPEVAGTICRDSFTGGAGGRPEGAAAGHFIASPSPIAFQSSQSGVRLGETHATLDANNGPRRHNGVLVNSQVRRLTPVECERLQGFPDGYTAIPWRGKPADQCPDGPRYKALGNSWAVPVARWIGRRINTQLQNLEAHHG